MRGRKKREGRGEKGEEREKREKRRGKRRKRRKGRTTIMWGAERNVVGMVQYSEKSTEPPLHGGKKGRK